MSTLVIVESPTKARTIRNYLPAGYQVEASMGHVRDLPPSAKEIPPAYKDKKWATLGINVEDQFQPIYVVPEKKKKVVKELKTALKTADELILATDEDREGESISWHLLEILKPKVPVKRMVFHEITKEAIQKALQDCREVDHRLSSRSRNATYFRSFGGLHCFSLAVEKNILGFIRRASTVCSGTIDCS